MQIRVQAPGGGVQPHGPDAQIDVLQAYVLELVDRPGQPCFAVERFLEGEYVKFSNNAGYQDFHRNTPHAFSHFTFEYTRGEAMVVDIQGVQDLYTDPQILTRRGDDFGEGNLGLRGMALFLYSHRCNDICRQLCLPAFELHDPRRRRRPWESLAGLAGATLGRGGARLSIVQRSAGPTAAPEAALGRLRAALAAEGPTLRTLGTLSEAARLRLEASLDALAAALDAIEQVVPSRTPAAWGDDPIRRGASRGDGARRRAPRARPLPHQRPPLRRERAGSRAGRR